MEGMDTTTIDSPRLTSWVLRCGCDPARLGVEQRVLVGAALAFLEFVGHQRLLVRFVAYFLSHCGIRMPARLVGLVVGRTSRGVEMTKAASVAEFVHSAHKDGDRHDRVTLDPVHAGPIARFLFEHPKSTLSEIGGFAGRELGVQVGIDGVRVFLARHGLADLRREKPVAPLL